MWVGFPRWKYVNEFSCWHIFPVPSIQRMVSVFLSGCYYHKAVDFHILQGSRKVFIKLSLGSPASLLFYRRGIVNALMKHYYQQ
jgi:hypothetical protein